MTNPEGSDPLFVNWRTGMAMQIPTDGIADGAVTTDKIADNAVTTAKISPYTNFGTWTPTFDWQGANNMNVTYTSQVGVYMRIFDMIYAQVTVQGTINYTMASGAFRVMGLPFPLRLGMAGRAGMVSFISGVDPSANLYDNFVAINGTGDPPELVFFKGGLTVTTVTPALIPTGRVVLLQGSIWYPTNSI